jgi:hypothetical protein
MTNTNLMGKLVFTGLFISLSAIAHAHNDTVVNAKGEELLCKFAPENDLYIPAGTEKAGEGIDEATFNKVIDRIEAVYRPIVKARGGNLKINRKWNDGTVNANAMRFFGRWNVNMYGGLARYSTMTADGFSMVLCHELGHHLGGYPNVHTLLGTMADEGQSDYFAATKCFRRVFENDDNVSMMGALNVPKEVTSACTKTFKSQKEIALCQRTSMTGKVLAQTLWSLGRQGSAPREPVAAPEFNTPTTAVVSTTDHTHPLGQCRLDTMYAGAICGISYTEDFAKDNASTGACAEEKGDLVGIRPHCWYKPGSNK